MTKISIFWFRRDLRFEDNHALFQALSKSEKVIPVFIFDTDILSRLPSRKDRRIQLIWDALSEMNQILKSKHQTDLLILHGEPTELIPALAKSTGAEAVFTNTDYEPAAILRDQKVEKELVKSGIQFNTFKDHVIFHRDEITKEDGKPYVVFTPYSRAWKKKLATEQTQHFPSESLLHKLTFPEETKHFNPISELEQIGFEPANVNISGTRTQGLNFLSDFSGRIQKYGDLRDFPSKKGVSYLSPYLRFGMIGIRECVTMAKSASSEGSEKWLGELIWRDFYSQILWHFPHSAKESFNPVYKNLVFPNDEKKFKAWCVGKTGFPIVDAAMRQLNQTGWMHNRLRMVAASFLVKDLHIDWRWGEQYFADSLIDFDLTSNNGGWQWAASTGCDAQPYFRIFNPELQSERFDPDGTFIRKYVPELAHVPAKFIHNPSVMSESDQLLYKCKTGDNYPEPVVNHKEAKVFALELFKKR
ncbi:MAG: deoxyribodipyrimidine photo-lyase [Bacteroidetes bacterium]|nr:deoxyribodipyrimidine photo-lyase [Bacteroidota bacterium]